MLLQAQGGTFDKVVLDVSKSPIFSHGQLFVALSRVRSQLDFGVIFRGLQDGDASIAGKALSPNVVYKMLVERPPKNLDQSKARAKFSFQTDLGKLPVKRKTSQQADSRASYGANQQPAGPPVVGAGEQFPSGDQFSSGDQFLHDIMPPRASDPGPSSGGGEGGCR